MAIGNQLDLSRMYAKGYLTRQLALTLVAGDYIVFQNDNEITFFDKYGQVKTGAMQFDEIARTSEELVYLVKQPAEQQKSGGISPIVAQCAALNMAILTLRQRLTQLETEIEHVEGNTRTNRRQMLASIQHDLGERVEEVAGLQAKLTSKKTAIDDVEHQLAQLNGEISADDVDENAIGGAPALGERYGTLELPMPAGKWGWLEARGATASNQAKLLVRTLDSVRGEAAADIVRWYSMHNSLAAQDQDIDETTEEWLVFGVEIYPLKVGRKTAERIADSLDHWEVETTDDEHAQTRHVYFADRAQLESDLLKANKNKTSTICVMMAQVSRGDRVRFALEGRDDVRYWFAVE